MEMPEEPLGKPHIVVHPVQKARQLRVMGIRRFADDPGG